MPPTIANGKICYLEIPATDVSRSADFYRAVFGWNIRQRGDGQKAFDDTVGEVSGTWVVGRPPATKPGLLMYVMVDSGRDPEGSRCERRGDRTTGRRRCTRDHSQICRPGWKRDRPLSGASVMF
jgi:hypothetical protein